MQKVKKSGVETGVVAGVRVESRVFQSKVRVRLDSGVKRGAKTRTMGKVGRRGLEWKVGCKVKCKEKWKLESSWRGFANCFPGLLTRLVLFAGMYLPSSSSCTLLQIEPG